MSKNNSRKFFIRVTPKRPDRRFARVIGDFKRNMRTYGKEIAQDGLRSIKEQTPARTGNTRQQWKTDVVLKNDGSFVIWYDNPSPIIDYINKGTDSSPGRFVKVLGRRVRDGTHPGIQGTKFLDRAVDEIDNMSNHKVDNIIRDIKNSVAKNLRSRGK